MQCVIQKTDDTLESTIHPLLCDGVKLSASKTKEKKLNAIVACCFAAYLLRAKQAQPDPVNLVVLASWLFEKTYPFSTVFLGLAATVVAQDITSAIGGIISSATGGVGGLISSASDALPGGGSSTSASDASETGSSASSATDSTTSGSSSETTPTSSASSASSSSSSSGASSRSSSSSSNGGGGGASSTSNGNGASSTAAAAAPTNAAGYLAPVAGLAVAVAML
ncbi:hypothetical protein HC256_001527 [Beauveria bassiana]|nr:hypothetical protein HC256_001527 [Beauveria bassiana]